ncbi:hypothetical protein BJA01nite_56160 [Bradyrhizobium japonicum]|nr:hypothetical protein BJ6T_85400 [Bradyrhizobium japonicum USDA 6]GEC47974.1 hypothetical protein BJA01nite_56160 [Bradyrhizobium japonicum]
MVHPDDGDEEIADCVADDGRPEFEQSIEARSMRRAQVQGENCNNDCKNGIREGIQAFCLRRVRGHHSYFLADAGLRGSVSTLRLGLNSKRVMPTASGARCRRSALSWTFGATVASVTSASKRIVAMRNDVHGAGS